MTPAAGGVTPGGDAAAPLLEARALDVSIGVRAVVRSVCLEIRQGEILALAGASGSGKSLTALALARLLPAAARASGAVTLRGERLESKSEAEMRAIRGRHLGLVFQEPATALNPLMRVGDQVAETVRLHGRAPSAVARAMAREAFELVGLPADRAFLERHPYELSGGQRQRVAIAAAVVLRPALLIADEPTTALDATAQAGILRLLRGLAQEGGMGMLLITHDLAVVAQTADRVAIMSEGEIVEQGSAQRLAELRHPYARALLAAARLTPRLPPAGRARRADMLLEARNIVREYQGRRRAFRHSPQPLRAVDEASLTVGSGEVVGLVGESGSGKSSLMRVLLALDEPQAGEVVFLGERLSAARGQALRRLRRAIQVVFQDPSTSFDPRWSVERLVSEPLHLLDTRPSPAERHRRVQALLEQVGLEPGAGARLPHEFSGGERQRIAIARALATEPRLIVCDEAVSALDGLVRAQILTLLGGLVERTHAGILFVSHDLNVVRSIADRVYVMQRGKIVEQGATEQVFTSPQHAHTRALIAATALDRG